jgi:hypothetical protein
VNRNTSENSIIFIGKRLFLLFLVTIYLLPPVRLSAQTEERVRKEQLWLFAGLEYKVNNDIKLGFGQGMRFLSNSPDYMQYLTDIGGYYIFSDLFKIGAFYRFRLFPKINAHQHEFYTNFINTLNFGAFSIKNRLRLHLKFFEEIESLNFLRYRLLLSYKLTEHFRPYAYGEIFYLFHKTIGEKLSKGRYAGGIEFKINNHNRIDFFLLYSILYNSSISLSSNIIGFYYIYSF